MHCKLQRIHALLFVCFLFPINVVFGDEYGFDNFPSCTSKQRPLSKEAINQCLEEIKVGLGNSSPEVRAAAASIIAVVCDNNHKSMVPYLDQHTQKLGNLMRTQARLRQIFVLALISINTDAAHKELEKSANSNNQIAREMASIAKEYIRSKDKDILRKLLEFET